MSEAIYSGTTKITNKDLTKFPDPIDIKRARLKAKCTLEEAAAMVYVTKQTWINWEKQRDHRLSKRMHPAYAELFALKAGLLELAPIVKDIQERRVKNLLWKGKVNG